MTYHYYIITTIIIIIILNVISHMAENLVSVVSAAWAGLTAIFLFWSGFSFKDTDDPQDISGKGGGHLLFHSTTSTSSWTFRHLFATSHVRWLSHIFNRTTCIYQTATRWDLQPYRITIWLIDDVTLSFCLFTWWFDSSFFVTAIWDGKPADSNSHQLSPLYYKRTD